MKKCPHCDRVLMATLLPKCSWCGGALKEEELQKTKEEVLDRMQKRKEKEEYEKAMKKHGKQVRKNFEEGVRGFY